MARSSPRIDSLSANSRDILASLASARVPPERGTERGVDFASVRRYLTFMKTTISTKGQLILPADIRRQDHIEPGQEFNVERIERGEYRIVRVAPPVNEGLVDWLLACPEKDFFVAIESGSTDSL